MYGPGRGGFTAETIDQLQRLIMRHNILTEETIGLEKCVVTVHNLIHLPEDIDHFSSPDNYWCYPFERAVCKYMNRSTNKKNIECTYANAECRREFLKFSCFKDKQPLPEIPEGGLVSSNILTTKQIFLSKCSTLQVAGCNW